MNGIDVRPCMACGPANLCASICVLQERRRGHRDEELGFRLFFWGGGREELSSFSKSAKQRERERENQKGKAMKEKLCVTHAPSLLVVR